MLYDLFTLGFPTLFALWYLVLGINHVSNIYDPVICKASLNEYGKRNRDQQWGYFPQSSNWIDMFEFGKKKTSWKYDSGY